MDAACKSDKDCMDKPQAAWTNVVQLDVDYMGCEDGFLYLAMRLSEHTEFYVRVAKGDVMRVLAGPDSIGASDEHSR